MINPCLDDIMKDFKGQVTTEYLVVTGVALLILSTVILGAFSYLNTIKKEIALKSSRQFIYNLCETANLVSQYSIESTTTVRLYLPEGFDPKNSFIDKKFININTYGSDINDKCSVPLTGTLPEASGLYTVIVTNEGDHVAVSFE